MKAAGEALWGGGGWSWLAVRLEGTCVYGVFEHDQTKAAVLHPRACQELLNHVCCAML